MDEWAIRSLVESVQNDALTMREELGREIRELERELERKMNMLYGSLEERVRTLESKGW